MYQSRSIRDLTEMSLLAALIIVTGSFKIPGPFPGTEFQLSAPLGVAIAAVFGFRKYFVAGIIASTLMFALGAHNIINVAVSIIFRLVAGGMVGLLGSGWPVIVIAGPVGSAAARLALAGLVGKAAVVLVAGAVPGMIYTALAAWPLTKILQRIVSCVPGGRSYGTRKL